MKGNSMQNNIQGYYEKILELLGKGVPEPTLPGLFKHSLNLNSDYSKAEYYKLTGFSDENNSNADIEYLAYSAESIVISKDQPLIIPENSGKTVHLTFSTLTLEPGGQIICNSPVQMNVDTFIKN